MSHIFKFYVGTSQNRGVLPYLSDLLNADPSGALQATVKAVGLACMSGIHHLPGLRRLAAEEYSKALQATNLNLQDTASATSDSTLGAVVTLSLYEVMCLSRMLVWERLFNQRENRLSQGMNHK